MLASLWSIKISHSLPVRMGDRVVILEDFLMGSFCLFLVFVFCFSCCGGGQTQQFSEVTSSFAFRNYSLWGLGDNNGCLG